MPIEALAAARSFLFVPGDRPERFDKAMASGADQVIVDLEDAVVPDRRTDARAAVAAWLSPHRPVLVRINAVGAPDWQADLDACRHGNVAGIVVPKAGSPQGLAAVRERAPGRPLLPLIETAEGMAAAGVLAASEGVVRLLFGTIDFRVDLGIPEEGEGLVAFRSQLVLASRLAGIAAPVDGVTTALRDEEVLAADIARARRFGFAGKLCIHPAQVTAVNDGFRPADSQRDWAQRVLAAASTPDAGVRVVDGRMVDRPVILEAERILRQAGELPDR